MRSRDNHTQQTIGSAQVGVSVGGTGRKGGQGLGGCGEGVKKLGERNLRVKGMREGHKRRKIKSKKRESMRKWVELAGRFGSV